MTPSETITIGLDLTGLDATSSVSATSINQESVISTAVITGPKGDTGLTGPQGPAGTGMPAGGSTGQFLKKASSTDYDLAFANLVESDVTNLSSDLAAKAPSASPVFTGHVTVPTPANATDAATKAYVDATAQGLSVKTSVNEATTAALPTNVYNNGSSGSGATLTASSNGVLTVDGNTVALNDRVLVKNEVTGANNGIYVCTTAGAVGAKYVLTRSTDMDASTKIAGAFVFVTGGTTNLGNGFVVVGASPFTIGTTAITWTQFSGGGSVTAGSGLSQVGSVISLSSPVSVDNGGTGASTLTGLLLGAGTSAVSTVTAPTGTVVGTSDTQTLTNKNISGSTNTFSSIPESAVTSLTTDLNNRVQIGGDIGGTTASPTVTGTHLAAALPIAQGGTGSTTQNFVDLSNTQTIAGAKTFSSTIAGSISGNAGTVTTNANLSGDVTSVGNATTLANTSNVKAVVQTNRLDQMAVPTADISLNSHKLTNVTDPVSAQDAATKAYTDSVASGLFVKAPVRAASTANVTIATPGATIDGVTLASGDRVLLKNQSTAKDNGIYIFNGASSSMTRSTDANTSSEVQAGLYTFVDEGTANADTSWVLTTTNPITLNTTALTFVNFSSASLPDASATIKGKVQLAGDLGGTASTPLIKRTSRFIIAPYGDTRPADYTCAGASNNQVEINAAIIAANALTNGADVELLDGTFVVSAAILRLPNVHIYGQGMVHTKVSIVSGGDFSLFDMDKTTYNNTNPLNNSILANMEIDASNMLSSSEHKCVNGGNFTNSKLYRLYCHDSTATGIGDDDFYGTTIDQCIVQNCGYENKRVITAASWAANAFTFTTSTAHGYTAWLAAAGTLTASGTVSDGDTVTIDTIVYTFKTTLTGASFEVLINGSAANALTNLKSAINLVGTIGTDYGTGTVRHPSVTAGALTSTTLAIAASTIGTSGNSIGTTASGLNLAWGGSTLSGGASGSKIVIAGMIPALYNGTFNVTSIVDSTNFTISGTTNSSTAGLNFTINPGTPTTFGNSSDSLIGHNGIGIASGNLTSEACIITNCIAIGNQNNNFLIEADSNNEGVNASYIFSNCISINAGGAGFRNTGSLNAQFNNCYDYGSPIGALAVSVSSTKTITAASWSAGVVTFTTSAPYLFVLGAWVQIANMVPAAYNGYYAVQSTPTSTTFTVNLTNNPSTATYFGTVSTEIHPVDGSSFNNVVLSNNLNIGLSLPSDGVIASNPVIKNCYNYGIYVASASNCRINNGRIYNNGRQGILLVMGGGVYKPMDSNFVQAHVYNNGTRFASTDGVDVQPSTTSAAISNLTLDVRAFDNQATQTQRYGVLLRSGGTLTNILIRGNLSGNLTAPLLLQNTGDTIYVDNVVGVNPKGKSDLGNVTGSTTFDASLANFFTATLTGNITAVMSTPTVKGTTMVWVLTQDSTGSRTLTLPANGKAAQGGLTLSTAANAVDVISWVYDGSNWRESGRDMSTVSLGTLSNLAITTANAGNAISLNVTQNDTTNNPDAVDVTNAGTSHGLKITQSGISAANKYGLFVDTSAAQVNAPLVRLRDNSASSTQATLQLDNAGSGFGLDVKTGGVQVEAGTLTLSAGVNIVVPTVTGSQIGTSTSQKLAFFGSTAIVQPGATTDLGTVLSNLGLRASGTAYPITTSGLATLTGGVTISAGTLALSGATITNTGTLTLPTSSDTLVGRATTDTLTNKAITTRINSTASSATPAINTDTTDQFNITALAAAITSMTSSLTGTPTDGQRLRIRIKDNGTARAITWGASFGNSGVAALPSTTVISKTHMVGLIYDAAASLWVCMASDTVGY